MCSRSIGQAAHIGAKEFASPVHHGDCLDPSCCHLRDGHDQTLMSREQPRPTLDPIKIAEDKPGDVLACSLFYRLGAKVPQG